MVSPSNSGKSSWTMILLGALGAGKSTIVNILNSKNTNANRVEFVASNSFKGFTKDFVTDVMPMSGVGIVKLIDSPGLADPNIPIDQWVKKYNLQLKGEAIDLVVCLIEYAERPSTKEL
jgi:putative ribosome biogenesis GTPase RsgA